MIAAGKRGLVWDDPTLDAYITDPTAVVPGTTMDFIGIADAKDRADLIAYLKEPAGAKR